MQKESQCRMPQPKSFRKACAIILTVLVALASVYGQKGVKKVLISVNVEEVKLLGGQSNADASEKMLLVEAEIKIKNLSHGDLAFFEDFSWWPEAEIVKTSLLGEREVIVLKTIKDRLSTALSKAEIEQQALEKHAKIISPGGTLTLHSAFRFGLADGASPNVFVVQDNRILWADLAGMKGLKIRVMHGFVATDPDHYFDQKEFLQLVSSGSQSKVGMLQDRLWSQTAVLDLTKIH